MLIIQSNVSLASIDLPEVQTDTAERRGNTIMAHHRSDSKLPHPYECQGSRHQQNLPKLQQHYTVSHCHIITKASVPITVVHTIEWYPKYYIWCVPSQFVSWIIFHSFIMEQKQCPINLSYLCAVNFIGAVKIAIPCMLKKTIDLSFWRLYKVTFIFNNTMTMNSRHNNAGIIIDIYGYSIRHMSKLA